jgi:hypothetical protein
MVENEIHASSLLDPLLQQRQGLGDPPSECIGYTQGCREERDYKPDMRPLRKVNGPLEHGEGMVQVALAQQQKTHSPIR